MPLPRVTWEFELYGLMVHGGKVLPRPLIGLCGDDEDRKMRKFGAFLLLLSLCWLTVGCGGTEDSGTGTDTPAADTDGGDTADDTGSDTTGG